MRDALFFIKIVIRWVVLCVAVGPVLFPNELSLFSCFLILMSFWAIAVILTIDIPSKT